MLVCPQCQFENPDSNRFCQKCGYSLSYRVCHECGKQVEFSAQQCKYCGAATAVVWWVIISKSSEEISSAPVTASRLDSSHSAEVEAKSQSQAVVGIDISAAKTKTVTPEIETDVVADSLEETDSNLSTDSPQITQAVDTTASVEANDAAVLAKDIDIEEEAIAEVASAESEATSSPMAEPSASDSMSDSTSISGSAADYLDSQNRYQLLDPLPVDFDQLEEVELRAVDTQPLKKSPLAILLNQEEESSGSDKWDADMLASLAIPEIAHPYLVLQSQLYHMMPEVHDAWEEDDRTILLIEDRSQLPMLVDRWRDSNVPPLQILHWLYEMAELWASLEPINCCCSLLVSHNLRVDEDQALCLQRLYLDDPKAPSTLVGLGEMWQELYSDAQSTALLPLNQLIRDLKEGKISTVAEVRSRIEVTAYELQANAAPMTIADENAITSNKEDNLDNLDSVSEGIDAAPEPISEESIITDVSIPSQATGENDSADDEFDSGDDTPTIVLPMRLVSLTDAGRTDVGRQRTHNEDYFGVETSITKLESPSGHTVNARGLYILCDGMGGHAGGEVASALAVKTLREYFSENWQDNLPSEDAIREAIHLANQAIYNVNQEDARSGVGRMGTTLVMVLVQNTNVAIAHVGDSRLYRVTRKRGLNQLTVDHEVGQREIQRGVEPAIAYGRPDAYQLTQALGPRDDYYVVPDIQFMELNEDTLFILCSDGLSDNDLLETHWQTSLAPLLSSRSNLEQGVGQLIELANTHNGHDNITALLIRAKVRPNVEQSM